ncbi:MAG: HdeD family acid-resistance protein [Nodosilinea sp.]
MAVEPPSDTEIKATTGWVIAISLGLMLLGVLAILMPNIALAFFTSGLGWLVLLSGILQIMQSFQAGPLRGRCLSLGGGTLYAIAGLYILINPVKSAAVLAFALGLLFIAEGIFTIAMAFGYRAGRSLSWFVAINGIVTLILGILVFNGWPFRSIRLIGAYMGISLLLSGASLLSAALAARKELA